MNSVRQERVRILKAGKVRQGPVVYWMSRDQRMRDNWALLYAQQTALDLKQPLLVVFCLVPRFLGATIRQYAFMLKGLRETALGLEKKNISFSLIEGAPQEKVPLFLKNHKAGVLITDFDPLRLKRQWKDEVIKKISVPFYEVDAHNIVPCWAASPKQEFGAYTLRPKINKVLQDFLEEFPDVINHPFSWEKKRRAVNWSKTYSSLEVGHDVPELSWVKPGERAAVKVLKAFLNNTLDKYDDLRNDPNKDGTSNLSPYLHFGQISAQRVALTVLSGEVKEQAKQSFLEELIVRRELSDNFCFYNKGYDRVDGFPDWAKKTLRNHAKDKREYEYTLKEFEKGRTHDELWNAAQTQMVNRGKMHGYMRMYWAKKILEWTKSPQEALRIAIYLNDKYELDGRDPNGYAGVAWAIGGVHDRAWGERKVFGKVRYMSYNGCKSKFDVPAYIKDMEKG